MKKILSLLVLVGATASLSACGSIPACNDELDDCTYGGPYTEERTIPTGTRVATPAPVVVAPAAPAPAAAPVVVAAPAAPAAPAPAPVVVQQPAPMMVDTHIMQSAEPAFRQISK